MIKNKTVTILIALIFITIIAIFGITVFLMSRRQTSGPTQTAPVANDAAYVDYAAQAVLGFEQPTLSIAPSGETVVPVLLSPTTEVFSAATVQLLFDPSVIEVISVTPGSFWTAYNEFENVVDNNVGEVIFSAGRAFDATGTGDTVFALVTVRPLSSGTTQLTLGEKSLAAGTDEVGALRLATSSLTLIIE